MASLVELIDKEVEKRSLLKHPFYEMWSKGELSLQDLSGYSKEYFRLVKAVPDLVQNVLARANDKGQDAKMETSLEEERQHVELWVRFARSLGVTEEELCSYTGLLETKEAVAKLREATSASFEEAVAAMYAYELEIPKISATKVRGLKEFYNLDSSDARVYFETHEEADIRHAALWRSILAKVEENKRDVAFQAAVKSLEAQNQLLDSVMKGYASKT